MSSTPDDRSDDLPPDTEDGADTVVPLASGGSVVVTDEELIVQPGEADRAPNVTDLTRVKRVVRIDNDITIFRVRLPTMQITLMDEDDAVVIETALHVALDQLPESARAGQGDAGARGLTLGMLACATLVVIGSIAPWAEVEGFTINGLDGDGSLTIVFGLMAGALAGMRLLQPARRGWVLTLLLIAFALTTMVGIVDWVDLGRTIDGVTIEASVGWGLPLMTVAGGVGFALALAQYLRRPRGRTETMVSESDADIEREGDGGDR